MVSCEWELTAADGTHLSSNDYGPRGARHREHETLPFLDALLTTLPTVDRIEASDNGAVTLHLTDGYVLSIRPCDPPDEPGTTLWRFMPKDDNERHFVVAAGGIEVW